MLLRLIKYEFTMVYAEKITQVINLHKNSFFLNYDSTFLNYV